MNIHAAGEGMVDVNGVSARYNTYTTAAYLGFIVQDNKRISVVISAVLVGKLIIVYREVDMYPSSVSTNRETCCRRLASKTSGCVLLIR